jgi:copper(I)-binding protein
MRPLKKNLLIKPGTEIEFKPQSYHLMFFELNEPIKVDQMLKVKLNFDNNFFIPVEFKVVINSNNHNHH